MRVHRIRLFYGRRGPERVRVHRIRLFYGRRGSDRVLGRPIGTESRPTDDPEASRRGEGVICLPFGTAALPTDTSGVCLRGKAVACLPFGTEALTTDASEACPSHGYVAHALCLRGGELAECLFFRFFVVPEDGDISRTCVITNDTKT